MEDIDHYRIPIYNFPYDVEEDDEDTIQENIELRVGHTFSKPLPGCSIPCDRLCSHSLLSALKKRSRSMASPHVPGSTPGVSSKLTTLTTLTLSGSGVLSLGMLHIITLVYAWVVDLST